MLYDEYISWILRLTGCLVNLELIVFDIFVFVINIYNKTMKKYNFFRKIKLHTLVKN